MTQLLLLGAVDSIQKKYWKKLNAQQKIALMETLFSALEFAASYNSYSSLRMRMQQIQNESRPPLNLLRQELVGTCIYLDILQKATASADDPHKEEGGEEKLGVAEDKLVSFCEQVLRDASEFHQSSIEDSTNMEVHRILELRSPITVEVLKGMCQMNSQIFRNHLREFYPLISRLVCFDQMEVRGALADLFRMQLNSLLPTKA